MLADTAFSAFSSPAPVMFGLSTNTVPVAASFRTPRTAVFTMADRTSGAIQVGWASSTSAAVPATCGVAMDVPWKNAQQDGSVCSHAHAGCELNTFTPGATTSGLIRNFTSVGPSLEKPAMMLSLSVLK